MKNIIIDIIDDLKCISLSEKGWNYVGLIMMIISGIFWISTCGFGDLFKILGCVGYIGSAYLWITKSGWGKWMLNNLFEDDNE